MIIWLSEKMADALVGSGAAKPEDRDIYVYGMDVLLSTVTNIICIVTLGMLLGRMLETLLFLAFFILLRSTAGGFHANTHMKCFLIMLACYIAAMALLSLVPIEACWWLPLAIAAAAATVVAVLAPAPHENRPVTTKELIKFRKLSLFLAVAQAYAVAMCVAFNMPVLAFAAALGMMASAASLGAVYLVRLYRKGSQGDEYR